MSMNAGGCAVHSLPSLPRCGRVAPPFGAVAVVRSSDALPRGGGFPLIIRGGALSLPPPEGCRVVEVSGIPMKAGGCGGAFPSIRAGAWPCGSSFRSRGRPALPPPLVAVPWF